MKWMKGYVFWLAVLAALPAFTTPAFAQTQTSNITGRATDDSGGALPGVTVSVTSPNLIGGARTAVTDDQGVYRFTQLPGGTYVVKFELPGFTVLNVEGVQVAAGATMTINGKLTWPRCRRPSPSPARRRRSTSNRRRSPSTGISRSSTICRTAAA